MPELSSDAAKEIHKSLAYWANRLAIIAEAQTPDDRLWKARLPLPFIAVPIEEFQAMQRRLARLAKGLEPLLRG